MESDSTAKQRQAVPCFSFGNESGREKLEESAGTQTIRWNHSPADPCGYALKVSRCPKPTVFPLVVLCEEKRARLTAQHWVTLPGVTWSDVV